MAGHLRLAGEIYIPTPEEIAGLSRISLAVNESETLQYLMGVNRIHPGLMALLHSVKIPNGAFVPNHDRVNGNDSAFIELPATRMSANLALRGATSIWNDTKFSNDGTELAGSIDKVRHKANLALSDPEVSRKFKECGINPTGILPPAYISLQIMHMADPEDISEAIKIEHTGPSTKVLGMVSTSKKSEDAFDRYRMDASSLTASMVDMSVDSGITGLIAAAADAKDIRKHLGTRANGDIRIYGTGAILTEDDIGEHEYYASIADTASKVDVFLIGKPILFSEAPDVRLLEFARAITAYS